MKEVFTVIVKNDETVLMAFETIRKKTYAEALAKAAELSAEFPNNHFAIEKTYVTAEKYNMIFDNNTSAVV